MLLPCVAPLPLPALARHEAAARRALRPLPAPRPPASRCMADAGGAVAGVNGDGVTLASAATTPGGDLTLARLRGELAAFAAERDWNQFHTPRNLCMALSGEVGEVAECFQWRSDADCAVGLPTWSAKDKQALGEELSDCLMYLVRLADRSGVDLDAAVLAKLAVNRAKYPAERCKGSAAKYTAYAQPSGSGDGAAQPAAEQQ